MHDDFSFQSIWTANRERLDSCLFCCRTSIRVAWSRSMKKLESLSETRKASAFDASQVNFPSFLECSFGWKARGATWHLTPRTQSWASSLSRDRTFIKFRTRGFSQAFWRPPYKFRGRGLTRALVSVFLTVVISRLGEPGEFVGRIVRNDPVRDFHGYADKKATESKIVEDVWKKGDSAFLSGTSCALVSFLVSWISLWRTFQVSIVSFFNTIWNFFP